MKRFVVPIFLSVFLFLFLVNTIKAEDESLFTRNLELGSVGKDVVMLQNFLKEKGYYTYATVTGYFGEFTREAVAAFQKANNLEQVGSVGPLTRNLLSAAVINGTSTSGTASVKNTTYGFENLPYGIVNGFHGGIDFGRRIWATDPSFMITGYKSIAFYKESATSGSFTLPAGKVLKGLKISKSTDFQGTSFRYTISDGVNPMITGTAKVGTITNLSTKWTKTASKVTLTANWDVYIDDITYANGTGSTTPNPLPCKYTYSAWSACAPNNTQTRTVLSATPSGCEGTPVLSRSCNYVPPANVPAAPNSLRATVISASQINLSWVDRSTNELGFIVERSTNGTNFTALATTTGPAFQNINLNASTKYYYRVKAFNAAGSSAYSNVVSATTNSSASNCSYTYSAWGACQSDNTQTRTVVSATPVGCTGTPVLTQSCTYVPPSAALLVSPPQSYVNKAIAHSLIRFSRSVTNGMFTVDAWDGGSSIMLAEASYAGNNTADARLLQQIRYSITGGNDIIANGGVNAQTELWVTGMFAIAKNTPRIWNQLTADEKNKIDLVMKASLIASAFVTSDSNPYVIADTQRALDGDTNMHRDWNPNYRQGMLGGVLLGASYFGQSQMDSILKNYVHSTFVTQLRDAGLTNIYTTFNWKAAHSSSNAPSGTTIENTVKNYHYYGKSATNTMGIFGDVAKFTYDAVVNAGINNGAGIGGAGKIVSGASSLPNLGEKGMILEFDTTDEGGTRSSAGYSYDDYRANLVNLLGIITSGIWNQNPSLANELKGLMIVGNTDLFYKLDRGYIDYSKGANQGLFASSQTQWGFDYNRPLWDPVLTTFFGSATPCTYTYSAWGSCQSNNTQTRNVVSATPTGCVGTPVVTQNCTYVPPVTTTIVADHTSVAKFSQIPNTALVSAAGQNLMMNVASVGGNISDGLDTLAGQNAKYDRSNWIFQTEGNPAGGWRQKVDDFVIDVNNNKNNYNIFSMKFCFIDNKDPALTIWNYYRDHMEQLQSQYPNKKFIWWTRPLVIDGDSSSVEFNGYLRSYAQTHNIILFDLAAIESHQPNGTAVKVDGNEALYIPYAADNSTFQGHLSSTGEIRVAQAFWYLMARIAGWNDSGTMVVPAAPSSLTATPISSSQINLAWTDNSNNETGFMLERSTNGTTFASLVTSVAAAFQNTGLTASTKYYYRVKAVNTAGSSGYSNVANATTLSSAANCTYTYSAWGACQSDNTQTRTVLSSTPAGCVGTPVLTQSCTYVPPTGKVLVPGNGFSGATPQPATRGSSGQFGYRDKAIARWDIVPFQTVTGAMNIGVVAFHNSGINRVDFSVNGGPWTSVSSMSLNPDTNVNEYWATLDASKFGTDGKVEIRAIIYPNIGIPRVLQGDVNILDHEDGVYSLFMTVNGHNTLPATKSVYVSKSGSDSSGDGSQTKPFATISRAAQALGAGADGGTIYLGEGNHVFGSNGNYPVTSNRWLTITRAPGTNKANVKISSALNEDGLRTLLVKFYDLTFTAVDTDAQFVFRNSLPLAAVWIDKASLIGPGRTKQGIWLDHGEWEGGVYVTNSTITACSDGTVGTLERNVTITSIGSDAFSGVGMVVNSRVTGTDSTGTEFHPDFIAFYSGGPVIENKIYYGVYGRASGPYGGQGIFDQRESPVKDIAIVDADMSTRPDAATVFSFEAPTTNLYVKDSVFEGTSFWRNDFYFDPTDVVIENTTFDEGPYWGRNPDSGVTVK